MERYFMIFNTKTGKIKGFYLTGIWAYENIIEEVGENESLKEINQDLWSTLIGNNEKIYIKEPKLRIELIEQFNNIILLSEDLENYVKTYFEETVYDPTPYIATQQEKDIKFLAETLKSFIEPMPLPSEGESNPALERLQEIIDRYS